MKCNAEEELLIRLKSDALAVESDTPWRTVMSWFTSLAGANNPYFDKDKEYIAKQNIIFYTDEHKKWAYFEKDIIYTTRDLADNISGMFPEYEGDWFEQ